MRTDVNQRLVNHVFLPSELPGNSMNLIEDEHQLLSLLNDVLQNFNIGFETESMFTKTKITFNTWESFQENLDPNPGSEAIRSLNSGETFALYVRAQNAGFMITALENSSSQDKENSVEGFPEAEEFVAISSFPASQPSGNVTEADGSFASTFPYLSVVVPKNHIVNSKSLIRQLHDLNLIDVKEAVSTIVKSGHEAPEKRDVPDPLYISKWITATLSDRRSRSATFVELPRVTKKIRDNVIFDCNQTSLPFRRSGLWMSVKVVLQICLTKELGKINGLVLYKLILIKFMLLFLKNPAANNYSDGLLVEMMGKVARRSCKLEIFVDKKNVDTWLKRSFDDLMEEAANTLKSVRQYLKTQLENKIDKGRKDAQVHLTDINLVVHLSLKNSGFSDLLQADQSLHSKFRKIVDRIIPIPPTPPRHREFEPFNPLYFTTKTDLEIVLYDFERNVLDWDQMLCIADGDYIWNTFQRYLEVAKNAYKGDPIGTSRMIITLMKIVQIWDGLVVNRYPMLIEHRPGVDLSFTEDLLITEKADLNLLNSLEIYFNRRQKKASFPSLIEEAVVSTSSYSARHAAKDPMMTQVRAHIEEYGRKQASIKLEEVHQARANCEQLEKEMRCLECEYVIEEYKRRHNPKCQKCRLRKIERNMKVTVYEYPLPNGLECSGAVIFELLIPDQIAILRDLVYLLGVETTLIKPSNSTELHGPWSNYVQIKTCNRREKPYIVDLMSTRKLFLNTHYKDLHPLNPDSDFVRANGYNCVFAAWKEVILGMQTSRDGIKNRCTLKVEKKSRYFGMQWAVNGNELSSNEVLARQSECHPDLSLMEFGEFGSLRCQWFLQWRNIFRALTQCSLSLKEESVFHLICQTIWQAGPPTFFEGTGFEGRRAHCDFKCSEFTKAFLNMLENIRQKHVDNWKDHYVLLTIIFLAQRVRVLAPAASDHVGKLLLSCRQDAMSWSTEIQRILSTLSNAPRSDVDKLRIKLIEVNVCCALTFRLDKNILMSIIESGEFKIWLKASAKIHDNIILLGPEHKVGTTLRNLLRRVDEVGVYVEPFIKKAIETSDLLTCFVESHHEGSTLWRMRTQEMHWAAYESDQQVYFCDIAPIDFTGDFSRIQMDIIKGRFLVDGCPVGYLPSSIENHPDFQRVFSTKSFEVQPKAFQTGRMITRDRYLGSAYSFYLDQSNALTITEHRENNVELELIPHHYFKDNVPHLLIKKYTHWYNIKAKQFEFFYRDCDNETVSKLTLEKPSYILELKDKLLYQTPERKRVIVDVSCHGHKKILQVVERLENFRFINLWHNRSDKSYTIDMPRMGLQFTVRNVNREEYKVQRRGEFHVHIFSKEYRGMKVSPKQESLETLIEFKSGLLLEDADITSIAKMNSILLVPHGKVIVKEGRVSVNMDEPRSPPFFAYEVDARLKQLKAGESRAGWVYLAYLHAITSQPIADPFTGVTGTERALQILQSGQSWSCQPLDKESLRTMKEIAALSPIREYYPVTHKLMETVRFENSPHVCHDAFQLVVEKLIHDSERLRFLFPDESEAKEPNHFNSERDLCVRAYWRRAALSTELGRINPKFDSEFDESPLTQTVHPSTFDLNFLEEEMTSVLMLAQQGHEWSYSVSPATGMLKNLFFTGKDLKGIFLDEGFPIKEGVHCWSKLDFRDYWLDLYNLARRVKRKDLKSEWTLLLTYFAFREYDRVDLDHLRLLQTVAVNSDLFLALDPPTFEEYSISNQYSFKREKIIEVLERHQTTWESYMDKYIFKMECYEDEVEFAERMRPIHENIVHSQASEITDIIIQKWPIDSCEGLFDIDCFKYDNWDEINLEDAEAEINILLKNWYRNSLLYQFIIEVENIIGKLATRVSSHSVFKDTRKFLMKSNRRGDLDEFCEKPLFVVDMKDILLSKADIFIDDELLTKARRIFCDQQTIDSVKSERKVGIKNSKIQNFPLEIEDDCPILQEYMRDLKDSWEIFHRLDNKSIRKIENGLDVESKTNDKIHIDVEDKNNNKAKNKSQTSGKDKERGQQDTRFADLSTELRYQKTKVLEFWEKIKEVLRPLEIPLVSNPHLTNVVKQLIYAELFPRVLPLTMLNMILDRNPPETRFIGYLRTLIGAYAVLVTKEQQAIRCVRYGARGKNYHEVELMAELKNKGHENWNPSERPEWLLFEIEMDLMIRPIQAKVAERMENPENNENALMQLNMGEGKTYVIVPLLVLSLANGRQLCRVTVLKSLYQMNKNSLVCKIGGILLNRRVYSFPCRRDYKIGSDEVEKIQEIYEECVEQAGVVMTLPEHRLSFELKGYERCHVQSFNDARDILSVQDWLKKHARDILDESDEILHVKYQLIYTLGKQLPIGGGSIRWTTIQDLIKILPQKIESLLGKYGPSCLEFTNRKHRFQFPYCRILKTVCASELCTEIARDILAGHSKIQIPDVTSAKKEILMKFLTEEQLNRETLNAVFKMYPIQAHQDVLLILRGFLACGVLCTSLTKRWRVNYGVNPTGYRRMAVPFRAKDVASERTEFGHPDVAIFLSQLSYYYSGLTDEQLEHCFVILFLEPNPSLEYDRWISLLPKDYPGYLKISKLSGVNLNDFFQKTEVLFPALRCNVAIIDFWLGHVVFPQESKQFAWKIGCSPWDLCLGKKNRTHATTGFSGTNDSKILLPKTITQNDLQKLQGTNGEVLRNLLLKENDRYEALKLGVTGTDILTKLVDANIRVLLDVGALMLELNNEQVARLWLKKLDENQVDVDAAIYFDENDKLVVMDRSGNPPCAFELSTYRTRLDRCVIYLDDVHTRGTDLKIPGSQEACVTLGKGVTKDKLVQGCMRMRKLGQPGGGGHRVLFWASQEVHNAVRGMMKEDNGKIGTREVLQWTIKNNQQQIKDGFIHWASAGVYQAQKLSSLAIYNTTTQRDNDLIVLAENCSQKEQIDLKAMYGDVRTLQKFPVIVRHLLKRVNRELEKLITRKTNLKLDINQIVEFFGKNVVAHSERYVGQLLRSTQLLDEEQERELEHELEAQHQKQLPGKAKAAEHSLSDSVLSFILSGRLHEIESWAVKLPLTLKSTNLWSLHPYDFWAKHIYASKDFSRVINPVGFKDKMDDFLRPMNWIASVQYTETENGRRGDRNTVLLLLSPFEANRYIDLFRAGETIASLHMFAPRLTEDQDTLHQNSSLILPYKNEHRVSFSPSMNSCLLLFSGSSYFQSAKEQDDYCHFVGHCARPRSLEEEAVFEEGGIVDGFVLPEFIHRLPNYRGPFQENPEKLVRGLIQRRFGAFSMDCHVGKVVFQCTKPFQ